MEITIRNAELNDSELITDLSIQLGYESLNSAVQHRLKNILTNPDHCVYVATLDGKVVGWVHGFYAMRVESDFFVEIAGLVVTKNIRKNGIGKKLVDRVIEWTKFKNCTTIRVRSNVLRKESHRFYVNIGFEITKEQIIFNKQLH